MAPSSHCRERSAFRSGRSLPLFPDPGSQGVDAVAFGPGGTTVAVADKDGTVYVWPLAS
jgi:WD40 repeat protein